MIVGLSSPSAQKALNQSSRNESVTIDRKMQSMNEAATPLLGSTHLGNASEIQELLSRQQQSEARSRMPQSLILQ